MLENINEDIWLVHDKRLNDQSDRISNIDKSMQSIENEVTQLIDRINLGISPTQQKILSETAQIRLTLNDIDHKLIMSIEKLDRKIDERLLNVNSMIQSHDEWLKGLKRVFVWGILTAVVAFGLKTGWNHLSHLNVKNQDSNYE